MFRLGYIAVCLIAFMLPLAVVYFLPNRLKQLVQRSFYKTICWLLRIKISVKGNLHKEHPVLFASNHVSYLDILVLGASLPSSFISKAEVGKWPVVGTIAKLTGTVLIKRKKTEAGKHLNALHEAIDKKRNLTLFPEGTTGDGVNLLPFKSSLFKLAEEREISIQPVTVRYTAINGLPLQRNEAAEIAWIGDMDLEPHLKQLLSLGIIEVEIILHEPLEKLKNRKKIATECEQAVASGLGG